MAKFRSLLGAAAATAIMTQAGFAADMAVAPVRTAPILVAYNWTGFYLGLHAGWAWGDVDSGFGSGDISGGFAGAQFGWNWQGAGSPWVVGVEIENSFGSIDNGSVYPFGAGAVSHELNYLGTGRLRLGYAFDRAMLYATGGLAWGRNDVGFTGGGLVTSVESKTQWGWVLGFGGEWGLVDGWSVKLEYLYHQLTAQRYLETVAVGGLDTDVNVSTVKLGVNYRFNWAYDQQFPRRVYGAPLK